MAEHHEISQTEEHPELVHVQAVPKASKAQAAFFNQQRCSREILVHPRRNYGVPHLRHRAS